MQRPLAESQAFLQFFFYQKCSLFRYSLHYILPWNQSKNIPSKVLLFHAKYFKLKKKVIQSPNKRSVSCLDAVYWMNRCTDQEQCRQTHHIFFPSLTLPSEKQQQDPQLLRHLASLSLKAGTLALNEIWVLTARH